MAQDGLESNDIWRQVPPEEKLALMAKVQGKAVTAVFGTIIVGSTLALSLKVPWALWASLIFSPLVFHAVSTKAWKGLRPRLLLEYLAARSAARRYAFSYRSKDLTMRLLMRGTFEEVVMSAGKEEDAQAAMEMAFTKPSDVWMALFGDCAVVMREQRGGAELLFAHLLNHKLQCQVTTEAGQSEYSNDTSIILSESDTTGSKRSVKLTSPYPAALVVLAKLIQAGIAHNPAKSLLDDLPVEDEATTESDDFLFNNN